MQTSRSPTLRILSAFLVLLILLSLLPASVFADTPEEAEEEAAETLDVTEDAPETAEEILEELSEDPFWEKYGISMEELEGWLLGEYHSSSEEPEDLYKVNENNPLGLDTPDGLTDAQWYEILQDLMGTISPMVAPGSTTMGPEFQIYSGRWAIKGYTSGGLGDYATVYYRGTEKTIKQYSFKYMVDANGTYYAPYCIDPPADFADSGYSATEYFNTDWWSRFNISAAQARAILLTLLYGSPNGFSTARGTAQYYAERAATQTIIWELLCQTSASGSYLRNSTPPFTRNSDAIYKVFGKSTLYYNGGTPIPSADMCDSAGGDLFANAYNAIASKLESHGVVPSFSSDRRGNAPEHKMTRNTDGSYSITLTDTNNVLGKCSFSSGNGVTYSVSGNKLTVTASSYAAVPNAVVAVPMSYPNFETEPILIWEKGSMQAFASLGVGKNDPVPCYFSLTADLPYGDLEIVKTTNTGSSLSGWVFDIFSGKTASGNPVKTVTSGADGKIAANDLTPGWYTIAERAKDGWVCDTAKTVEVKAGEKASVSFSNTQLGKLQITKSTNTGKNKNGWVFDVYSGSTATGNIIATLTTGADGTATSGWLTPGKYTIKERAKDGWICDTTPQTVTVSAGTTIPAGAKATFSNTQMGKISVQKKTNIDGYGGSWKFNVYQNGKLVTTITTDANTGYGESGWLAPGNYEIYEDNSTAASYPQWVYDASGHNVTVTSGNTVNTEITNTHLGRFEIYKSTNTGKDLGNWEFDVFKGNSATGTPIATLKTDAKGYAISGWLQAGIYTIVEHSYDGWQCDTTPKTVTVVAGTTVDAFAKISVSNTQLGKAEIVKAFATMEPNGMNPIAGWQFTLTSEADGKQYGPYSTDSKGKAVTGWLLPGWYSVSEIIPEGSLYTAKTNPQRIEIKPGTTAQTSVTFTNALKPAKLTIRKVDPSGNPLAGAKFLLEWSKDNGATWNTITKNTAENVVVGGCSSSVADGCLTTDSSGIIEFTGLHPQLLYRVTELEAPPDYLLLADIAWQGKLDSQTNLSLELTVHNSPGFILPNTGTTDHNLVFCGAFFAALAALLLLTMNFKNYRRKTK